MSDMQEPTEKRTLVEEGQKASEGIHLDYQEGIINEQERDQQLIALWTEKSGSCR